MGSDPVPLTLQAAAYIGLVVVQTFTGVIYRTAQSTGGKYEFSPLSAICLAELFKLCMSLASHVKNSGSVRAAWHGARSDVSGRFLLFSFALATLYCINNRLSFKLFQLTDPGTLTLFRTGSAFVSAVLLWGLLRRAVLQLQWVAIVLQVAGLIAVQYDACAGASRLEWSTYALLFVMIIISSISGVFNEHLLKTFKVSLSLQNIVLYTFGFLLNLMWFFSPPAATVANLAGFSIQEEAAEVENVEATLAIRPGFFHGFDRFSAVMVVVMNACMGLVITMIYKYADVVIKTFAVSTTTVILVIISFVFFDASLNIVMCAGMVTVLLASYIYISEKLRQAALDRASAAAAGAGADA